MSDAPLLSTDLWDSEGHWLRKCCCVGVQSGHCTAIVEKKALLRAIKLAHRQTRNGNGHTYKLAPLQAGCVNQQQRHLRNDISYVPIRAR